MANRGWLALAFFFFALACEGQCLKMDIMMVGDYSGSVDGHQETVSGAFGAFANRFEKEIRIGMMVFSNVPETLTVPTSDKTKQYHAALSAVAIRPNGNTNMSLAINVAGHYLWADRFDATKMLILISDGLPDSRANTRESINALKSMGTLICTVTIQNTRNWESIPGDVKFMQELSTGCAVISTYEDLIETIKNLEICF